MSNYVPKPDIEGINSPAYTTPVKDILILITGAVVIMVAVYFVLVAASDWALTRITIQDEIKFFGKIFSADKLGHGHSADLDKVAQQLTSQMAFPVQLGVKCSSEPNAFAVPGGTILITSGLLENLKSENGLTFVLGHELGHFINRDHIRGLGQKLIFAIGMSLFGFSDVTEFSLFNDLLSRAYDRNKESGADDVGLSLSKKIYGHTFGAEELFAVLAAKESDFDRNIGKFMSTHPASAERLALIKASQVGEPVALIVPERPFKDWVKDLHCP